MIRQPAVAGHFYPDHPKLLEKQLKLYLNLKEKKQKVKAIIVPHAGYIYSGGVAGAVYSKVEIPSELFILSPNHTGLGAYASINSEGKWKTPFGEAIVDQKLAKNFMKLCPLVEEDELAHQQEHSLEVQIPFLQFLRKDFEFVPLTIQHLSFEDCVEIGEAIAQTIQNNQEESPPLLISSTDMNHYESQEITLKKDQIAIDAILELNPEKLYREVHKNNVTMCGIIPTTITLIAANKLSAKKAELIRHSTSGDVSGDYEQVVGYAGFMIS